MSGQREGWPSASLAAEGSRQGGGTCASAAAGAAAPPSSALSEISRASAESHHSIYSQRSRWSTAATVATTRVGHLGDLEPPLPEEGAATLFSGSSSTASGDMGPLSTTPSAAAQLRLSRRDTSDPGSLSPRAQPERRTGSGSAASAGAGQGSPVLPLQQSPSGGTEGSAEEASAAAADSSGRQVACGTTAAGSGRPSTAGLPPRLIVFHPDGSTFGIGVDKQREKELQEAAEAAAAQRRQRLQQQAADRRAGGGASGGGGGQVTGRGEGVDAGWQAIFTRQKGMLIGLLLLDCIYLIVLLALRLVWGKDETPPNPNGAAQFFVGSHPESTSVSYLAGSLFTDCVALYGTANNYASVITLFIVWSVVLGAFAILEMPLLFIIIRLMLLVAAFQLRFSMARLRVMLPPTSHLANLFRSAGRGVAAAGSAVARPFRGRRSAAQPSVLPVTAPAEPGAATGAAARDAAPVLPTAARSSSARDRLRQHDDAVLMRVVREMQRQQAAQALQASGGAAATAAAAPAAASASGAGEAGGAATAAGSPAAGEAAGGAQGGSSQLGRSSTGSSLDRLYSQLMQDIAAVSSSPTSTRERRRQRRRERDRRRQQVLDVGGGGGASGGASSSRRGGGSGSEGEGAGPGGSGAQAAGASGSSQGGSRSRQQSGGNGSPGASAAASGQVELAGSRSRTAGRRSAPAGTSGSGAGGASGGAAGATQATPTWDDLVALLALHHGQQQQLRRQRQRHVDVVPLVSLVAPPPLLESSEPAHAPGPTTPAPEDAAGSGVTASSR